MLTSNITFNNRYLSTLILAYIISSYFALNQGFSNIKPLLIYSLVFVLILLLAYFIICIPFRKDRHLLSLISLSLAICFSFIFGYNFSAFKISKFNKHKDIILKNPYICGMIKSNTEQTSSGKSVRFTMDVYKAIGKNTSVTFDESCLIEVLIPVSKAENMPERNSSICCLLSDTMDIAPSYDGDFDYSRQNRQDKIVLSAFTYKIEDYPDLKPKTPIINEFKEFSLKIRNRILKSTELKEYGDNERALLQGILVGETEDFSDSLYDKFKESGFIHVVSVSGMHTSYLIMALTVLLGFLHFSRRGTALIAIPVLILFAGIAQFTPSVCRAVIMTIIMLGASLFKRQNDSITSLAIAGLILTVDNPYVLESYGALLSFGATLGILVYYPLFFKKLRFAIVDVAENKRKSFSRNFLYKINSGSIKSIALSLGATIGFAYFMMRFYGYLQWGSLLGNIIVIPFICITFVGGYINCVIHMLSPILAGIVAKFIINPSLSIMIAITKFFANDLFGFRTPYPTKTFFIVYIILCAILYYWLNDKKKKL